MFSLLQLITAFDNNKNKQNQFSGSHNLHKYMTAHCLKKKTNKYVYK